MKYAIVLSTAEPETAFNAIRFANFTRKQGHDVSVFLMGRGVDIEIIVDARFNVVAQAQEFLTAGGKLLACTTCLKLRQRDGSEVCPLYTMKDFYDLIQASERVVSF